MKPLDTPSLPSRLRQLSKEMTEGDPQTAAMLVLAARAIEENDARWDFIEAKAATIYCSHTGHWVFVDERGKKHEERRGVLGASVRGCIDAAMKEKK